MLVDSHCHLDFPDFADELDDVVARARNVGVSHLVTICTRLRRLEQVLRITERYEHVYCSAGTHPHNAHEEVGLAAEAYVEAAAHPKVVAIGEGGLDFHYDNSPRADQETGFRTQIEAARRTGLPLVVHTRDAEAETERILREEMAKGTFDAILHCYSSGPQLARAGVELGFHVSFSGILTFKRADELREIAASVPPDRLLVETDAPYLAPMPYRGKRNEPAYVVQTNEVLAGCHGVTPAQMAERTTANFFRLFKKVPAPAQAASG